MELHAFTLLCALAAIICSAHITAPRQLGGWLLMLLLGLLALLPLQVGSLAGPILTAQPSHAALLMVLAAAWLLRRSRPALAVALGGLLSAEWIVALLATGLPLWLALPVVLAGSGAALVLALRHPPFRDAALLQEALLILLAVALVAGLLPELVSGWHSATALQGIDATAATLPAQNGSLLLAALCVVLGILYTRWKYK